MNWYKKAQVDQDYDLDYLSRQNPYPFKDWFDDNGRAYFPFLTEDEKNQQEGIDKSVADELEEKGYQIVDYRKGYCSMGNRVLKIGKVLNNLKKKRLTELQNQYQNIDQKQDYVRYQIFSNQLQQEIERSTVYYDELINTFVNSSYRAHKESEKEAEFYIVISQNPNDIATMSTGRQWTSCMELGTGSHHQDVFCEIQNGGLVAYLIRADDTDITDPLARIHIRRFDNREGKSVAIPEQSVYGNEIEGFQDAV